MSELPPNWSRVTLGEVIAGFEAGRNLRAASSPASGTEFGVLKISAVSWGKFQPEENKALLVGDRPMPRELVRKGDLLISRANTTELVGAAVFVDRNYDHLMLPDKILRVKYKEHLVDPRYLLYALRTKEARKHIEEQATGTSDSMRNLSQPKLSAVPIPLAPLAEQKRIACKLDRLLAAIDTCKARLDAIPLILKQFRQSVLAAATSGELTEEWRAARGLQMTWQNVRLNEIAAIQGGITKDSKKQLHTDREVPYLRVANVQRGHLDLSEIKTIRVPKERLANLMLEPGDVLFTEGGDIDKLGRGWVWEGQIQECTYQNHIFRARLFDKRYQPKYVSWWANHRGLSYFLGSGKQTTNLASINKSQLSALPISLPSPEEQAQIVAEVEGLLAAADQLQVKIASARTLIDNTARSLLAKAFDGGLTPQDPNDEPASRLLERVRAATDPAEYSISGKITIRVPRPRASITISAARPNIKGELQVLKRSDVSDNHLTGLLARLGPVPPEVLFRESQLNIDDFYDQLKDEEERGLLREIRDGANREASILEAAP